MKIIENCILINTNDETHRCILINTLNGNTSVLTDAETQFFEKWKDKQDIQPISEEEDKFLSQLEKYDYLTPNEDSEANMVEEILSKCRVRHEAIKSNVSGVVFVVTYQCNFSCPYCYEDASSYTVDKIITTSMADKIFEIHNNNIKNIAFYGGEPFLPQTKEIIKYIISKAPSAKYSSTTNGYYLLEYFDLLSGLDIQNIMVTLDGPEDIHNRTRILKGGGKTYSKIIEGINLYLNHNILIKIRMNVSNYNKQFCLDLRNDFINKYSEKYEKGILMFELQPLFQTDAKTKDELNRLLFFDKNLSEGAPSKYNMMSLTVSSILKNFINNNKKLFLHKYCFCDAEGKRRFYDAEGNIYSCILSLKNPKAIVGKYYPEYFLNENSILTRNIEKIPKCKTCKLKFLCGGGCANGIIDEMGDVMKPNCNIILNELNNVMPELFREYII